MTDNTPTGPWRAVLADEHGYLLASETEAAEPARHGLLTVAVVRESGLRPEPDGRTLLTAAAGADVAYRSDGLVPGDRDAGYSPTLRYLRAQAMARGLNGFAPTEALGRRKAAPAIEPGPEPVYLVWSNDARAWWGPGGHAYRHDIWSAGRYTQAEARECCGRRTWPAGKVPPEVMVLAPESGRGLLGLDEIRAAEQLMASRIREAEQVAMARRVPEHLADGADRGAAG